MISSRVQFCLNWYRVGFILVQFPIGCICCDTRLEAVTKVRLRKELTRAFQEHLIYTPQHLMDSSEENFVHKYVTIKALFENVFRTTRRKLFILMANILFYFTFEFAKTVMNKH